MKKIKFVILYGIASLAIFLFCILNGCDNGSGQPSITGEVEAGVELIGQGNPEPARTAFLSALSVNPADPYAHMGIILANLMLAVRELSTAAEFAAVFLNGLADPGSATATTVTSSFPPGAHQKTGPYRPSQADPASLISLYLDPMLAIMEDSRSHLVEIDLKDFQMEIPSLPIEFQFDQKYEIDFGGEYDEFEIRVLGILTHLFLGLSFILKSLDLEADMSGLLSGAAFPINFTSPIDPLNRIRELGPLVANNPSFLTVQSRENWQSGLAELASAAEWSIGKGGSLFQALLEKDGTDPSLKVFGFVDEDGDGTVSEGDQITLNPVNTWNVSDPIWCSVIYLPAGISDFTVALETTLATLYRGLSGEEEVFRLTDLNPFLAFLGFGNEGKFPLLPDLARLNLAPLASGSPEPRDLLPQTDVNGEFMIEVEVANSEFFPGGVSWVTRGDGPHFGGLIPADQISPLDSSPASLIPYVAFADPSLNGALEIRESLSESSPYYPADVTSINLLIASLVSTYSRWLELVGLPPTSGGRTGPGFDDFVFPVDQGPVQADGQVFIQDVSFTNRENAILAGRLYWPESATTTAKVPGIIYCPGTICWLDLYHWIAMDLARAGYAVLIFEPGGQAESQGDIPGVSPYWFRHYLPPGWENDLYDSVTYLSRGSPVADLIESEKIGIMGHSRGSMAVCHEQIIDNRVQAAVEISGTSYFCSSYSRVPTQLQTADFDLLDLGQPFQGPTSNSLFYTVTNPPRQIVVIAAGSHGGFNTMEDEGAESPFRTWPLVPDWQHSVSAHYAIAWFDYFLKEDAAARDRITEPIHGLSHLFPSKYLLDETEGEVTIWP